MGSRRGHSHCRRSVGWRKVSQVTRITVTLRGEPTAVARPRFTRNGITYTAAKTRYSLAALRLTAEQAMQDRPPLEGPLRLDFTAELAIPRSWSKKKKHRAVIGEVRPTWSARLGKSRQAHRCFEWRRMAGRRPGCLKLVRSDRALSEQRDRQH